jgi:long-subunit fatty acid transport protein
MPVDQWAVQVNNGIEKVNDAQEDLSNWWDGLSAAEKLKPENIAKNTLGTKVIESASNFLNAADVALNDDKKATIQYSLEKNLKDKWNFLLGSQYQINRHWMVRAEYGFLGSRTQGLLGLQYRFGL